MRKHVGYLVALAAFSGWTSATAALIPLAANLTVSQEVGANTPNAPGGPFPLLQNNGQPRPLSFGTATFVLDSTALSLTMVATVFNIDVGAHAPGGTAQTPFTNDDMIRLHIHAPALPGVAAPIDWPIFESLLDANPANTSDDDLVITPFTVGVGGTITAVWDTNETGPIPDLNATRVGQLLSGLAYLNFHTVQFPGGEIRGQLVVPEPGTLALTGPALFALYCTVRRRKRK